MTLNITLLTDNTIYQSADSRVTDLDTKEIITDKSSKLVTIGYRGWKGLISYTGIGWWKSRDTSEFIVEWLNGIDEATFDDVAKQVCEEGNKWLKEIEAKLGRYRHTFILAGFESAQPKLAIISNFENCSGKNDNKPGSSLIISSLQYKNRPLVVVTGCKAAVNRHQRKSISHLINKVNINPAQIRRKLIEVNSVAAKSSVASNLISPACSVASFRSDDQGIVDGSIEIRSLMMGHPVATKENLSRILGIRLENVNIVGITSTSSKPRTPFVQCKPQIITPVNSTGYALRELICNQLTSCNALDINNSGVILGAGTAPESLGDFQLWLSQMGDKSTMIGLIAPNPEGGINESCNVVSATNISAGSQHGVLWGKQTNIDLGCFRGHDSGATAINASGLVVGWVCIDPNSRGQKNSRPAAWWLDKLYVLEKFSCDWGTAVDVNDAGLVLVSGYVGGQSRAVLWNPLTGGINETIGNMVGISPTAINNDGHILGTSRDNELNSIAWLVKPGETWERLVMDPGFYATCMNNMGDIAGTVNRDGYEKPLLKRVSGEIVWLPYFGQHGCRPSAINDSGVIVGTAQTDHGNHALVWTP